MTRTIAPLLLAFVALAPTAQAEVPAVAGAWRLEGYDVLQGRYEGEITFKESGPGRFVYERNVRWRSGGGLRRAGSASLDGQRLVLREAKESGLSALLRPDGASTATSGGRYAMFRSDARTAGVLQGVYLVSGTLSRGVERLERVAPGGLDALELLIDGPEAFPKMRAAMLSARRSICVQTFSWFDDASGRSIAYLLRNKAREGVKVRCLIEAFPQKGGLFWKIGPYLEEAGVEVLIHHTLTEGLKNSVGGLFKKIGRAVMRLFGKGKEEEPEEKRGLLNHDHRKIMVVDGEVAFTGGMNIGDKYEQGTTWHDVHCSVVGPATTKLEALFYERWRAAGGKGQPEPAPDWATLRPGNLSVEVLENLPGLRLEVTERYMKELAAARSEVLISNPYMLYDPVVNAIKRKAQQGVRTVVILPSNDLNDEALARDAFLWIQNDVVNAGVELYKYRERMTHGKVAVFDRRVATVGTTNLDKLAMENNAEVNLFVTDPVVADSFHRRVFVPDIAQSDRVRVTKLSWWEKVKGGAMHLIRGFL